MADHFDMQQIFGPHGLLAQALSHYEERPQQGEMSARVCIGRSRDSATTASG